MQVYVPLNDPSLSYEQTKPFAHQIAQALEREHPELVVSRMGKHLRGGKVLVDWSQNDEKKTTVNVYSLRAQPRPMVSTPLEWGEVARALKKRDASGLLFDSEGALARVKRHGDLFAPLLELEQTLPTV